MEALAIVGGADAAEAVGVALTDEDPDVQATAAQVLGRLRDANGHSVGVDKLLVALEAEDSTVRAAAARALGQTKEPRAEEPLRALLDGEEPFVVGAALEGLRLLGKPAVLERIDAFLIHPDEEVAKQALWLVSEIDLLARVWDYAAGVESRTVDTHVKRLRVKLGAASDYIETVRGIGYRMRDDIE